MTAEKGLGLIVEADEPALFFSSPEVAELYLEAIDVDNGVYPAAYDPVGNPYAVSTRKGRVVIEPLPDQPNRAGALKELLLRFLTAANVAALPDEDLGSLIGKCAKFADD